MPHTDPVPETLSSVPGYPNTLQIYMLPASSYWQVRAYIGRTLVRRSTKTDVRSKAIVFAKAFFDELLPKRAQGQPLTEASDFESTAQALLEEDRIVRSREPLLNQVGQDYGLDEREIPPAFVVCDRQRCASSQTGRYLNCIRRPQPLTRTQCGSLQQNFTTDWHELKIREVVEKYLIVVRDILTSQLQWFDRQLEQSELRGYSAELALFQVFDDVAGGRGQLGMLLEMIDPDARIDHYPLVVAGEPRFHQSLRSS